MLHLLSSLWASFFLFSKQIIQRLRKALKEISPHSFTPYQTNILEEFWQMKDLSVLNSRSEINLKKTFYSMFVSLYTLIQYLLSTHTRVCVCVCERERERARERKREGKKVKDGRLEKERISFF